MDMINSFCFICGRADFDAISRLVPQYVGRKSGSAPCYPLKRTLSPTDCRSFDCRNAPRANSSSRQPADTSSTTNLATPAYFEFVVEALQRPPTQHRTQQYVGALPPPSTVEQQHRMNVYMPGESLRRRCIAFNLLHRRRNRPYRGRASGQASPATR